MLVTSTKIAAPCVGKIQLRQLAVDHAVQGGVTLFTAPLGYLSPGGLNRALVEHNRPTLWLRLDHENRDHGFLLLSLIAAAKQIQPDFGERTLEQMRRQPGPVFGWAQLFETLGKEIAEALPPKSAIVFENVHHLNHARPTLMTLSKQLLPKLSPETAIILTSCEPLSAMDLPPTITNWGSDDLRPDPTSLKTVAALIDLPTKYLDRILTLTKNCVDMVEGALLACAEMGVATVADALQRANSIDDFFARLARSYLSGTDSDVHQALALSLHLDYTQPDLIKAAVGYSGALTGPWWQPLSNGWQHVREVWRTPLHIALRMWGSPTRATLRNVANYLASHDMLEPAIQLYVSFGDITSAAQVIANVSDEMLNYGLWDWLDDKLNRLPPAILHSWPWLVYTRGEIASAQGDITAARRMFAIAATLFTSRHEADGACQSLLAESTLACWQGDYAHAQAQAHSANTIAEAAGLNWHRGWAMWQLGCIAAGNGELNDALAYFGHAGNVDSFSNNEHIAEMLRRVEFLALEQREAQQQREYHRQSYFAAEHSEQKTAQRLHALLGSPLENLGELLSVHGWLRTPLFLKLPAPSQTEKALTVAAPQHRNLWGVLQGLIGVRPKHPKPITSPATPYSTPQYESGSIDAREIIQEGSAETAATGFANLQEAGGSTESSRPSKLISQPGQPADNPSTVLTLTVYLLGQFRVFVNDQPIESWPNARGRAIFKYLVTNRERPMSRENIMETFWPDATPEAGRNSLNVAMHGLRQAFRTVTETPIIDFGEGAYHFNPDFKIWLDVDEFDRYAKAGIQLEAAGKLSAATTEYETAAGLYQGEFLPDELYEEWAVLPRERLRLAHLDVLDRLSQIYFGQGHYASCATLCQLIIAEDNCREDAHCWLMRCYARQGQHHLALRQYESCVSALQLELDIKPSPLTIQLYERIRRRERI